MLTFRLPFNTSFFGTIYYDQMFREACSSIYKLINYTVLTHINTHLSLFKISSVLIFEDVFLCHQTEEVAIVSGSIHSYVSHINFS